MPVDLEAASDGGRNREIDWLRAYACMLVVLEHLTLLAPYPTPWSGIVHVWYEGRTGVDLFFVISGYVISRSFVGSFDRARAEGGAAAARAALAFYIKRMVRLWPAAAFWALVIVVASVACRATEAFPPPAVAAGKALAAVVYASNLSEVVAPSRVGHYYSLATEMQFYLALPIVFFLVGATRHRVAVLAAVFALGLVGCPGFDSCPQFRFAGIVAGILLFFASRWHLPGRLDPRFLARPTARALFTPALLVLLVTCPRSLSGHPELESHASAVIGCALVWAAIHGRGYVGALGCGRLLDWIGSRSYSIYLCHIPVLLLNWSVMFGFERHGNVLFASARWPEPALLAEWLTLTLLASELTYRCLERPFQVAAHRVAARFSSHATTAVEPSADDRRLQAA